MQCVTFSVVTLACSRPSAVGDKQKQGQGRTNREGLEGLETILKHNTSERHGGLNG